jgi:hypothetical protein
MQAAGMGLIYNVAVGGGLVHLLWQIAVVNLNRLSLSCPQIEQ